MKDDAINEEKQRVKRLEEAEQRALEEANDKNKAPVFLA